MITKVIPMSNSTSMALFLFPASVLSIVSITMELNGLTGQFAHAQECETLPLTRSFLYVLKSICEKHDAFCQETHM